MNYIDFKEKRIHGTAMFPLHIYSHEVPITYESEYHHWHEEIEILYVESGSLKISIDMITHTLNTGEFIFVNSEKLHSGHSIKNIDSIHHAIVFNLNLLNSSIYDHCQNKYIDPILNKSLLFPTMVDNTHKIYSSIATCLLNIIKIYSTKNSGWELFIKADLLKIIAHLAEENLFIKKDNSEHSDKNYKIELIKKTLNYIHSNYQNKIYNEDLATHINMNASYFCRFFKGIIGKTPVDYINYYRIEQAAKLLQTTDKKIMEICFQVGFDNFSYFIKKFKEYKGCTPNHYRS